ncbi:MAG: Glyoxalase/bleomycin resistance protein/dioxygenase [Verrucomicrobia bacterium]|nr:Glyoxalase/bleomycin resistance protein/dioxygenase [Verrucomicrobiota bacterium]
MSSEPTFVLRQVDLITRSIAGLLPFYRDTLGLVARQPDARTLDLHFSSATPAVITFTEDPAARTPTSRVAGLFHIAILVPDRPTLAAVLARLIEKRQPIEGLSDHGVSEAIYLSDPDGNGIEIYRDRARNEWPMSGDRVAMVTLALDHDDLLKQLPSPVPAAPLVHATLGHMHLQVSDLAASKKFYLGDLGLEIRQDSYPGALFMAADGYHHHVEINTWGHPARRSSGKTTGLAGFNAATTRGAARDLVDPDGIRIGLKAL